MSRSPHLIVIGAQKCGTTTLWEDLRAHPQVYMAEKESRVLSGPRQDRPRLDDAYARLFSRASSGQLRAEVSTRYAMLPDDEHTAANAACVAPEAKIVYIVRDPVDRVISHHHHDFGLGLVGPDIDEAIRTYPSLLDNTRYATQVEPWWDHFGPEAVTVVRFEDYVADRRAGAEALLALAGVTGEFDPGEVVHNAAGTKYVAPGRWGRLAQSAPYRKLVRPLMSERVRRSVSRAVLPKAPPRPDPPSPDSLRFIVDELTPEVERLSALVGTAPMWDVAASAARHGATLQ